MERKKVCLVECEVCRTVHSNQSDYDNHILGNKHKRKVQLMTDAQIKAEKQLYEKSGIFIFNLPPDTLPDEISTYVRTYGKIRCSKFGGKGAKFLFADEKDAINFKNKHHVFKKHTLKVTAWNLQIPTLINPPQNKPAARPQGLTDAIAAITNILSTNMDIDQEIVALQSALMMPPNFINMTWNKLCKDLKHALKSVLKDFSVHPFGSILTGLALNGSDMDVVIDQTFTLFQHEKMQHISQQSYRISREEMNKIAKPLRRAFFKVILIDKAKVPIIKCVHRSTNVNCDISFSNVAAVQNTHLVRLYLSSDPRVQQLMVILKFWAMRFNLIKLGGFTNYALVMMGLFYLMQLDDPLVPPIINLQTNFSHKLYVDGWNCSFDWDYHFLQSKNTSGILDLLQGFFEFYANFDYGMKVICPLIGKTLPKVSFTNVKANLSEVTSCQLYPEDALKQLSQLKVKSDICIQDPFILDCNLTKSVTCVCALNIQSLCGSSAFVLREDRGTCGRGPLRHLFKIRTEDIAPASLLKNASPSNNVEIRINVGSHVSTEPGTLSDAQNAWFKEVFDVVITIFKKIFKFTTNEDDSSAAKKAKTKINDVCASDIFCIDTRTIICQSKMPDLRSARKQVAKDLKATNNLQMSFLDMQEAISDQIILAQQEKGPIETVKFKCSFHLRIEPTHIIVELSDIKSSGKDFFKWSSFLSGNLSDWVRNIMNV